MMDAAEMPSQEGLKVVRIIARLNVGGPARHVVWLTAGLRMFGCETVLVTGVVPQGEADMNYFAAAHGLTPHVIPQMSRELSLKDTITVWKLYRLLRRVRPEVVHTHTAKAGAVGRVAGLLYRWLTPASLIGRPRQCRFVHTYHGHVFHSYYGSLKTRVFLLIEKNLARVITDRIIVLSEQQRREIHDKFRVGRAEQFTVIPLGLDLTLYANWAARRHVLRDELGLASEETLVGIVGRLTDVKNHELFLRVAALYQARYADSQASRVRFVVIGDGHLRERLEARARELKVAGLSFIGSRTDPENFYPALDVVALTSLNEGTPLTLIEAMANERPVIATAVGGVVDLLGVNSDEAKEGDNSFTICERGILVRSNDVVGFCEGLRRLICDVALRRELGGRGRKFVEACYSKERLLSDTANLYRELLQPAEISAPALASEDQASIKSHS
jgi:glycosyltransferase involved in cell wall biosynthesis